MKKAIQVGSVVIGGNAPISIQSMTNTDTADVQATSQQIQALAEAGCDIVRMSVYNQACAEAIKELVDRSPVPLVADIHFDHRLAIASIENGISKLRLNPGNITDQDKIAMVADCAKRHKTPIRIGVNSGSVPKDILEREGGVTPAAWWTAPRGMYAYWRSMALTTSLSPSNPATLKPWWMPAAWQIKSLITLCTLG